MYGFDSQPGAIEYCLNSRQFAISRLHKEESTEDTISHDCYEINLVTSGHREFQIGENSYHADRNDLFFIRPNEIHGPQLKDNEVSERISLFIHPDIIESLSTINTPLDQCFQSSEDEDYNHKVSLTDAMQKVFFYHVSQLDSVSGYGSDVLSRCRLGEFLMFLNSLKSDDMNPQQDNTANYNPQIREAIRYIDLHLTEDISLGDLAEHLYISESYLCRIFKSATGTTIRKYIVSRRIEIAKQLLSIGYSVAESQSACGFKDYSNFLKAFTRIVGMSPKKYAQATPKTNITLQS